MTKTFLILYTRKNCCLCEGLENRLRQLPLEELNPSVELDVIDIDGPEISERDHIRFDLEVPVMLLKSQKLTQPIQLPRISPRIDDYGLFAWLQKTLNQSLKCD